MVRPLPDHRVTSRRSVCARCRHFGRCSTISIRPRRPRPRRSPFGDQYVDPIHAPDAAAAGRNSTRCAAHHPGAVTARATRAPTEPLSRPRLPPPARCARATGSPPPDHRSRCSRGVHSSHPGGVRAVGLVPPATGSPTPTNRAQRHQRHPRARNHTNRSANGAQSRDRRAAAANSTRSARSTSLSSSGRGAPVAFSDARSPPPARLRARP